MSADETRFGEFSREEIRAMSPRRAFRAIEALRESGRDPQPELLAHAEPEPSPREAWLAYGAMLVFLASAAALLIRL